jgi:hypothetical protein
VNGSLANERMLREMWAPFGFGAIVNLVGGYAQFLHCGEEETFSIRW